MLLSSWNPNTKVDLRNCALRRKWNNNKKNGLICCINISLLAGGRGAFEGQIESKHSQNGEIAVCPTFHWPYGSELRKQQEIYDFYLVANLLKPEGTFHGRVQVDLLSIVTGKILHMLPQEDCFSCSWFFFSLSTHGRISAIPYLNTYLLYMSFYVDKMGYLPPKNYSA